MTGTHQHILIEVPGIRTRVDVDPIPQAFVFQQIDELRDRARRLSTNRQTRQPGNDTEAHHDIV
jgi:hypothetical protein